MMNMTKLIWLKYNETIESKVVIMLSQKAIRFYNEVKAPTKHDKHE